MSIATKMTAIADKIRAILGISGKMGLDAMSTNLGTVQTNLNSAYTAVGNKDGTVPSSKTIGNLASAINSIPEGVTVQRKSGTFTTDSNGAATVNCGWQPDVVYIKGSQSYDENDGHNNSFSTAIVFAEETRSYPVTAMGKADGVYDMLWEKSNTGFRVMMYKFSFDWNATRPKETFNYVAIKYT